MDLTAATVCAVCGAPLQQDDRFCEQCGARLMPEDPLDDRIEQDLVIAGAVSDRGRVHRRNEDAVCIEVGRGGGVAVVCDGISSASAADAAARTAAGAAGSVLVAAVDDASRDPQRVTLEAIDAAHEAVGGVPWTTRTARVAPSCTLVCALWRQDGVMIGGLGDSRAYWHDGVATFQLTADDSWAEEEVAAGRLTREQAMRDPRSHSITHWVGADAPARPPDVRPFHPERAGRLVLCTDGLWNYLDGPGELGELIEGLPAGSSPAAVARALTEIALERGGRDNITVAVIDIPSNI